MTIGVIGLGYVGLPIALAFAKRYKGTVGFDLDWQKVKELNNGLDRNKEVSRGQLASSRLKITDDPEDLKPCDFFIVAVPTPVDKDSRPDLAPVVNACETVGKVLKRGDIVVFESTVYPGVTEDICGPILAKASGLRRREFRLGYSPERINPGDKLHTLERIVKVVSGEDRRTLEKVAKVYGAVVKAGIHKAPSIKVAEAAKVIENTQRDLNIALMNELAIIFERMGIRTADVLAAAGTKWNFLKFQPGHVGGHCIGVDPYYLTTKAQQLGYHPQVILAGRRINDDMGVFVAQKTVKLMIHAKTPVKGARVGILGITFKEDVRDLRNSRVPDIVKELRQFGVQPLVHDPIVNPEEARREYGIELAPSLKKLDGLILAVGHKEYRRAGIKKLCRMLKPGGVFLDVKSVFDPAQAPASARYWSL